MIRTIASTGTINSSVENFRISPPLPLNQESLHAFAGIDLARVNVAFGVGRHHVQPMKTTAGVPKKYEMTQRFAVRAVHDPDDIVHYVREIDEGLDGPRERQAARGSPIQCFGCDGELSNEFSILREYLHAIGATVGGIDH